MGKDESRFFVEYYHVLETLCRLEDAKRKVRQIRQAMNEEEALKIYFDRRHSCSYDVAVNREGHVSAIKSREEMLKNFGVEYPTFEQVKENIK